MIIIERFGLLPLRVGKTQVLLENLRPENLTVVRAFTVIYVHITLYRLQVPKIFVFIYLNCIYTILYL